MYYDNFAKLCEENGIKPGRVSRETGISTATLTSWKQGKYTPKQDKLQKIADYFGVPLIWITGDGLEEEMKKSADAINEIDYQIKEITENSINQNREEQLLAKLIACFNALSDKRELLDYAEYLVSKER